MNAFQNNLFAEILNPFYTELGKSVSGKNSLSKVHIFYFFIYQQTRYEIYLKNMQLYDVNKKIGGYRKAGALYECKCEIAKYQIIHLNINQESEV